MQWLCPSDLTKLTQNGDLDEAQQQSQRGALGALQLHAFMWETLGHRVSLHWGLLFGPSISPCNYWQWHQGWACQSKFPTWIITGNCLASHWSWLTKMRPTSLSGHLFKIDWVCDSEGTTEINTAGCLIQRLKILLRIALTKWIV